MAALFGRRLLYAFGVVGVVNSLPHIVQQGRAATAHEPPWPFRTSVAPCLAGSKGKLLIRRPLVFAPGGDCGVSEFKH